MAANQVFHPTPESSVVARVNGTNGDRVIMIFAKECQTWGQTLVQNLKQIKKCLTGGFKKPFLVHINIDELVKVRI